jgi:hypothetical protein
MLPANMRGVLSSLLLASAVAASFVPDHSIFHKREVQTCDDLTVSSNNGDRKVAIVIDSSLSMEDNDPSLYRIAAARALNNFLIANGEASGNQKPDQVSVIDFAASAFLDYPLGDPAGADKPLSLVSNNRSGTFIGTVSNLPSASQRLPS